MEKHNRKSHLAPQLSPATRTLLNGSDSPTTSGTVVPSPEVSNTPTSGEIFITGLSGVSDVRSTLTSPRDHVMGSIHSARSPTKLGSSGTNSLGRSSGTGHHPPHAGLQRMATTNSIPTISSHISHDHYNSISGASSANAPSNFSMNLPMRPAPAPGGELPPPPPVPRKEDGDKKENRRQATFGLPQHSNGHYRSDGLPRGNDSGAY